MKDQYKYLIYGISALAGSISVSKFIGRSIINRIADKYTKTIMTDKYHENMWEFVSASRRVGLQEIVELNMRSEWPEVVKRPLGSPRKFPSVDGLMFSFAQVNTMPTPGEIPIDTSVIVGKNAKKPLILNTPIIIGGMAYGFALSEKFRLALAKGSSLAGTAFNTGQSGFLPKERKLADKIILQYNRGHWSKSPDILRKADAIELHFGQGAVGGMHSSLKKHEINKLMRKQFQVKRGQEVYYHSRIPDINRPEDLLKKVRELRAVTDGIPIGAKIAAGDEIERDLFWCLEAGLDFVTVCGAESASKGSPPLLLDNFGLPIIYGLTRAVNYLEKEGVKDKIDILGSGKMINPGNILKALAMGCTAVYVGTSALFATAHTEVLKSMPFEPPTQVAWRDGKQSARYNYKKGAQYFANFIQSCTEEMKLGISVLGKTSVSQLSKKDLVAVDPYVAEITGIRSAHIPPDY